MNYVISLCDFSREDLESSEAPNSRSDNGLWAVAPPLVRLLREAVVVGGAMVIQFCNAPLSQQVTGSKWSGNICSHC